MLPLTVGQVVTYVDETGVQHAATVVEAYGSGALVNVPDIGQNLTSRRLEFEGGTQTGPYITDAAGGTDGTYEAPIAEE